MLEPERPAELEWLVRTHTTPKRMVERVQIVLWSAEGQTNAEVCQKAENTYRMDLQRANPFHQGRCGRGYN